MGQLLEECRVLGSIAFLPFCQLPSCLYVLRNNLPGGTFHVCHRIPINLNKNLFALLSIAFLLVFMRDNLPCSWRHFPCLPPYSYKSPLFNDFCRLMLKLDVLLWVRVRQVFRIVCSVCSTCCTVLCAFSVVNNALKIIENMNEQLDARDDLSLPNWSNWTTIDAVEGLSTSALIC